MPEGDGTGRGSTEMALPSDQYHPSASSMAPQRAPPAFFCSQQQTPHRVQSSTNLDLVDCVGSDLLLAMNSLDMNEQARACANSGGNGCHHLLDGGVGGGGGGSPPPPPPGDGFLPLAALAPPPSRQPAWLTSQQQKARVQNEHFPSSRSVFRGGGGSSGRGNDDGDINDNNNSSGGNDSYLHGDSHSSSPGMPPPGFGLDSCSSSQGSWSGSNNGSSSNNNNNNNNGGGGGGVRRPSSSNSNNGAGAGGSGSSGNNPHPHLDESWTAVLNAPAGAELMEFLTERASRALVLWNVEALGEDELRTACEAHGPLYYLRAEHRRKRVIFIAYYDVRDAVNAHRSLGAELSKHLIHEQGSRPRPAVHFSIELHAGFSYKEGSLVVHNLPAQATEAEVGSVFQAYGDLRGIARHSKQHQAHSASFSVEFCSIQDARLAAQELTVRNPWGHGITVEPAVRSETQRALGRQLHSTLNRWTAESTHANEERMRSTSSSVIMSGRSSDSDSPTPKPEQDRGRNVGYMRNFYNTPMTSANTTPTATPGSTPPSGADAYEQEGGKSNGVQHYMTMPLRQYPGSAGPPSSSSSRSMHAHHQHQGRSNSGSSSAPPHPMYASSSSSSNGNGGMPQHHYGGGGSGSGGHHHHLHHHLGSSNGHHSSHVDNNGSGGGKPHSFVSPLGAPTPYGSAPTGGGGGPNGYFVDASPGGYHPGDRDDTRTPPTSMWAAGSLSLSPPSARGGGGGMRGSPPMRGMPGGCAGGAGGLGYKDRSRQMSLDEGRLLGGGGGGGARMMRSNSDSASQILMSSSPHHGPECNGNSGHEFSLDLKKVSKGVDKRTTIMVRNIPNKYTQTMLLQEIDASYRGAYDFFYLPIDFKNKCNVGYAFINFIDYRRIVPFFREFNAQRWKNFNSEKVCAISYARIQGKASMISRFQNSSLMEKDGEYRPLIFHSAGTERGRPEPFPASSKAYRGIGVAPGGGGGGGVFGGARDRERSISGSSMA